MVVVFLVVCFGLIFRLLVNDFISFLVLLVIIILLLIVFDVDFFSLFILKV